MNEDEGFGDFDDFKEAPKEEKQSNGEEDGFGDFGGFEEVPAESPG